MSDSEQARGRPDCWLTVSSVFDFEQIDAENNLVTAEAGISLDAMNEILNANNLAMCV